MKKQDFYRLIVATISTIVMSFLLVYIASIPPFSFYRFVVVLFIAIVEALCLTILLSKFWEDHIVCISKEKNEPTAPEPEPIRNINRPRDFRRRNR